MSQPEPSLTPFLIGESVVFVSESYGIDGNHLIIAELEFGFYDGLYGIRDVFGVADDNDFFPVVTFIGACVKLVFHLRSVKGSVPYLSQCWILRDLANLKAGKFAVLKSAAMPKKTGKLRHIGTATLTHIGSKRTIEVCDGITKRGVWMFYALVKENDRIMSVGMPDHLMEMRLMPLKPKYVKELLSEFRVSPKLVGGTKKKYVIDLVAKKRDYAPKRRT